MLSQQLQKKLNEFDILYGLALDNNKGLEAKIGTPSANLKSWITSLTISILEAERERLEDMKIKQPVSSFASGLDEYIWHQNNGYNLSLQDQITYLDNEIKKIKE